MTYTSEIKRSMKLISKKKNSIFLGQSVLVPGNLLFKSLSEVNKNKRLETPVFEDTQLGMSIGLALNGFLPVCCYPRFDFFLLAYNQAINHLDKLYKISSKEFNPFVIVRVLVGSKKPIDAGLQHTQNYSKELRTMMKYTKVIELKKKDQVYKEYDKCLKNKKTTIFIEYSDNY